ncbi:MAG: accessory Sec system translocase SecA2 [Trebonia sp.]
MARRFLQKPGTADLTRLRRLLPAIAAREDALRQVPDGELAARASKASVGDDMAEFAAIAREAARRALGERPHDVQLLGTLAMLSGYVAEMATGEGKTLSGALAAAGYALSGNRVHVMSVNDYLARRDAEWMRPVYQLLGVSAGWIGQDSSRTEREDAYAAQVTYGAVSELGFDVLRDRLREDVRETLVPDPDVVLIDEADSVLIDEALVPLVLAGAVAEGDTDHDMAALARCLFPGQDYLVDDDGRNVQLTDTGARAAEQVLGGIDLYDAANLAILTRLNVALHAHALVHRDVHYIVRDGGVHLISESRGRVAAQQRWPDGLQAAIEAKEGLAASDSGEILDSITVESLVRRYPLACGMTGTAIAVGEELREFYGLEVAVIEPNRPCVREDQPDRIYGTVQEKEEAIAEEITAAYRSGQPVLVGTLDVAESERLADLLDADGLACVVLNAKNEAAEAAIIAEAGSYGAITVSTQMAGRGTDIRLGGTAGDGERIAALGGLYVIGTGRHASSRLDNQLRGRSGRQGDPGGSVFFVSLEDELITSHAPGTRPPRTADPDGRVTDASAARAVEHAQRVAESARLEIHRNTWRYNKLIEHQRQLLLEHRDRVLRTDAALRSLAAHCPERHAELSGTFGEATLVRAARQVVLSHLDQAWTDHLATLAELREGIHLRALCQGPNPFVASLDPLAEFHAEAVRLYHRLLDQVEEQSAETFAAVTVTADGADLAAADLRRPTATWTYLVRDNPFGSIGDRIMRRAFGR